MASPTIREQVTAVSGFAATPGAGTLVGDLVLVTTWETSTSAVPVHTLEAGYTLVATNTYSEPTNRFGRVTTAYKVATSAGAVAYQAVTSDAPAISLPVTDSVVVARGTYGIAATPAATVSVSTGTAAPNPALVAGLDAGVEYTSIVWGCWNDTSHGIVTPGAPAGYSACTNFDGSEIELANAYLAITGVTSQDPAAFTDNLTPNGTCSVHYVVAAGVDGLPSFTPPGAGTPAAAAIAIATLLPGLEFQGAVNFLAGTSGVGVIEALNLLADPARPRELHKDLEGVLNELAGTTGLGADAAAGQVDWGAL